MRGLAGFVYLAATVWWAFLMWMAQGLRCDDSCVAAQFAKDWGDRPDSWQYGVVGWLGLAGLVLAVSAVLLSRVRRWLGVTLVALHACLFTVNCLVWYLGRTIYGSWIPFGVGAAVVLAAGFISVGVRLPRRARGRPPTSDSAILRPPAEKWPSG